MEENPLKVLSNILGIDLFSIPVDREFEVSPQWGPITSFRKEHTPNYWIAGLFSEVAVTTFAEYDLPEERRRGQKYFVFIHDDQKLDSEQLIALSTIESKIIAQFGADTIGNVEPSVDVTSGFQRAWINLPLPLRFIQIKFGFSTFFDDRIVLEISACSPEWITEKNNS